MEYLHLITNETMRDLVQRVAQNDPSLTELTEAISNADDANVLLALGHALIGNTCLRKLRIIFLILTEMAAHALAQGMARSNVEALELVGPLEQQQQQQAPQDDDESASLLQGHRICDIFHRGIQASRSIQKLHLWLQSLIGDPRDTWKDALLGVTTISVMLQNSHDYVQAFSEILSRATLLTRLDIVLREVVEPDDMTRLAHGLRQNTSITTLCLIKFANNHQHEQHEQLLLAQGPSPNSAIKILYIQKCNMDDDCIDLLIGQWLPNCRMQALVFRDCMISPIGAQHLVQALAAHPTLSKLYLHNSKSIGYEGLRLIGNELQNLQYLWYLDLEQCSTWNANLDAESEDAQAQTSACKKAGQALLDGMKHNLSITELLLSNNHLPTDLVDEIDFCCALNKVGRYLLSTEDNHGMAASVWCHMFAKCQAQANFGPSLVYFYLKELPTLVQSCPLLKQKRG